MSGHPRVIGYLQRALDHEFGAAQQFTLQAGQADVLGLPALAAELRTAANEELAHAGAFIARLYTLGGTPRAGNAGAAGIGRTQRELLQHGMATEASAIRLYTEAARFCRQIGDHDNVDVFARILSDEEQHYQELQRRIESLGT